MTMRQLLRQCESTYNIRTIADDTTISRSKHQKLYNMRRFLDGGGERCATTISTSLPVKTTKRTIQSNIQYYKYTWTAGQSSYFSQDARQRVYNIIIYYSKKKGDDSQHDYWVA